MEQGKKCTIVRIRARIDGNNLSQIRLIEFRQFNLAAQSHFDLDLVLGKFEHSPRSCLASRCERQTMETNDPNPARASLQDIGSRRDGISS
jgi:hypothetical protein